MRKYYKFNFDDDNKSMISDFTEENICKQLFNESMINNNIENEMKIISNNNFTINSIIPKNNNSMLNLIRSLQNDITNLKNNNIKLQNENEILKGNLKNFMDSYKEANIIKKENNKNNNIMRTPFKEKKYNESLQNTACINNKQKKFLMRKRQYEN